MASSYRGVDQRDLILSVRMAFDLLRETGPLTAARIDAFLALDMETGKSRLADISTARTDEALAQAVRESGIAGFLSEMRDVLTCHAIADTGGQGRETFRRLSVWNALNELVFAVYTPLTFEIDSFLLQRVARTVSLDDTVATERFESIVQTKGPEDAQAARDIAEAVRAGDLAKVATLFEAADLSGRHTALLGLQHAAGWLEARGVLWSQAQGAIGAYGVLLGDDPKAIDWRGDAVQALAARVQVVLEPYYRTDEVSKIGMGFIGALDKGRLGIAFDATARAAQAVAEALPEQVIIDGEGHRILPAGPAAGKAPSGATPAAPKSPRG